MKIFADTASLEEIRRWLDYGVLDGVTTNPSIMLAEGNYRLRESVLEISRLIGDRPLSVEVVSDEPEDMLVQARDIASWAANIVVKIPIITTQGHPCLGVINELAAQGVNVNATACLSVGQAILATKAGARYASLFAGRISDEGVDAANVVAGVAEWLGRWDYDTEIIVGSIRQVYNVQEAALAGAHVVTVPPKFLKQMVDHRYSRTTVQQFLNDGREALARAAELNESAGVGPSRTARPS